MQSTTQMDDESTDRRIDAVPERATCIGIDADGARHYLGNRITSDGIPVFVVDDGVTTFDLSTTPCADADDEIAAWIGHVERKRGEWQRIEYGKSALAVLADALGAH